MRLKNIPGADDKLNASPLVIKEPATYRGRWAADLFGKEGPLRVEIGCGKGMFLTTLAAANPDVLYLGIEKMSSVLVRAVERTEKLPELPNLRFLRADALGLQELFAEGEIDRIYLNFSDPWPKDRHHKRRLTSREFLERYEQVLAPGGIVEFKTDNVKLFDFSLEELASRNWTVSAMTRDLHRSPLNEGNVMTEYEDRFVTLGTPICKLVAHPPRA